MGTGLYMCLLVRDEEDIIGKNIEFHRRHDVEHFIVTDNSSVDGTHEILKPYIDEGLVTYLYESSLTYDQDLWTTRMNRIARDMGAKFIINADADEFWVNAYENFSLREEFYARPNVQAFSVPLLNAAVVDGTDDCLFLKEESLTSDGIFYHWPNKVMYRVQDFDVDITQGNHSVAQLNAADAEETFIVHFPYRSYEQFESKVINGGSAYENNTRFDYGTGYHWRDMYEMYKRGELRKFYDERITVSEDKANELIEKHQAEWVDLERYLEEW